VQTFACLNTLPGTISSILNGEFNGLGIAAGLVNLMDCALKMAQTSTQNQIADPTSCFPLQSSVSRLDAHWSTLGVTH